MKFIHLSDLHLGKRVDEVSMVEDQIYIMNQIFQHICDEKPDGVLIAGDVYDRSVPPTDAIGLLDDFLVKLAGEKIPTFIISGNHDSGERLAFVRHILENVNIHISPVFQGEISPITLKKGEEEVEIFLLPFIKPVHVKKYYPEEEIITYTDAMNVAIGGMKKDANKKSILLTHQFVTGAKTSDSEEHSVGGSDNVDVTVFDSFDYVALGHLHGPQNVGSDRVRYCGTPLKYSFSEVNHQKSITVVELEEELTIRTIPLTPQKDMIDVKGTYLEVTSSEFYKKFDQNAYIRVTLTDEEDIFDAMARLRVVYPNLMKIQYDNKRTRQQSDVDAVEKSPELHPLELFARLYKEQNGEEFSEIQKNYMDTVIQSIWEGN